jgi:glucose/arabinose dehydrogenase/cytochrome c5
MTIGYRHTLVLALAVGAVCAALLLGANAHAESTTPSKPEADSHRTCPGDNCGLSLSPFFCATVFADNLGHARHMAFGPDGTLYVNTWSGRYFANSPPPPGGFLVMLRDVNGDGKAEIVSRFGETQADGAAGGSGIAVYKNYVYAEVNDKIVRYALPSGGGVPTGKPEVVLSGMPLGGDHPMHPFIIAANGDMFIDMGSATNSCQARNRQPEVPGQQPCVELDTRGGIWRYDANKLDQTFSPNARYATGIRNGEGFAFDAAGRLFVTQHGRDQLLQNWPALYPDAERVTELPAEEVVQLKPGGDYGWPYCYYDQFQKKLVLAPEYGGDGGKTVGVCADKIGPAAAFPGHWAPNDITIYLAEAFPAVYRGGVFIAFHGSWNRAPAPQAGYNVVFQPLKDGKAAGDFVVFADGFAGGSKDRARAAFRPGGLAVGPDGALYISDDVKGRIWRVTYQGPANLSQIAAAPAPVNVASPPTTETRAADLPTPPGSSREQVAEGDRIYHASACTGCHGSDAKGSPLAPDLTAGKWLWGDGSLAAIKATISNGVPNPKQYRSGMPTMGGAQFSPQELDAVAAYVWAVGHHGER